MNAHDMALEVAAKLAEFEATFKSGPDGFWEKQRKVERRQTHSYGLGVFATEDVAKGEVIGMFDGAIKAAKDALSLPVGHLDFDGRHAIQFCRYGWRDGKPDGIARYVAHSCDPNCGIINLFYIVTMRDVKAGEEISWDYAMSEDSNFRMDCLCGSPGCRGVVGSFSLLTPVQKETFVRRYRPFISGWLIESYGL